MKLKKLEITGFKSFVDKSSIEFPAGISAVVGPNGCGKSNIIDALRWVMGEQSVKQLRGKSMEDVIFSGTNGHPPMNMAEVSLTLANDNGSAPEELKDFSEIMLTRRLYRSGDSAYFINKQPCRLKDVHNIFLGSGMGTRSYAVIQQGNIGAIIDAGPEERRVFIEEAAGVTRYKHRKNEALRKVDATQQNLLRVSDIMTEVKRQMDGLKRQAKKAERYRRYQEQLKRLDVGLTLTRFEDLTRRTDETRRLLNALKDSDIEQTTQLKRLDAAIEEIKLRRQKKDQEISEQKSVQFDMRRSIDRLENDLTHMRDEVIGLEEEVGRIGAARSGLEEKQTGIESEMAHVESETVLLGQKIQEVTDRLAHERSESGEISARLETLNLALDSAKARLMECVTNEAKYRNIYQTAENSKENLKRRLNRTLEEETTASRNLQTLEAAEAAAQKTFFALKAEIETYNGRIQTLQENLKSKSAMLGQQVKAVQTLDLQLKELRSNYTTLKRMQDNFEWYRDGVRAIMKTAQPSEERIDGIIGLVADIIEPDPAYADAVEAVLSDALQYILVTDQQVGMQSVRYLETSQAGRGGFVPLSAIKPPDPGRSLHAESGRRLLHHVSVKAGYEAVAETLLGNVVLADDLAAALTIWNANGTEQAVVTKRGEVILPQGILIGGRSANGGGILAKKQELKKLSRQTADLEGALSEARARQESMESEVKALEIELQKQIEQKQNAVEKEIDAEKKHYKIAEDVKYARRHLEIVRLESQQLLGEQNDIDDEISKFRQIIVEVETEVKTAQRQVAEVSDQIRTFSSQLETFSQRIVDLKLDLTALNAKLENSTTHLKRLQAFYADGRIRLEELAGEIAQKKQKRISLKEKILQSEARLSVQYEELNRLEQAIENNRINFDVIASRLEESGRTLSDVQAKREEVLEKIRLLELELSQTELKRENLVDQVETRYHSSFSDLRDGFDQRAELADLPLDQMEEKLERLRKKVHMMGEVNLGAIREYETLKTRYEFLSEQHADLIKAIEDLHQVIRKINRITRSRFMETFGLVNEKLQEVFPRLFEGGSAQLVLTDPDDPLETGVEYLIHPPGKKLTRMSLLSGGEKALSAIAFIFSIFLIKPASFCLLDEIDAPLDDANVYRFNNLLQIIGENSQIVMITHNKRTMEFADTLFGITMEKKGVSKIVSVNFTKAA